MFALPFMIESYKLLTSAVIFKKAEYQLVSRLCILDTAVPNSSKCSKSQTPTSAWQKKCRKSNTKQQIKYHWGNSAHTTLFLPSPLSRLPTCVILKYFPNSVLNDTQLYNRKVLQYLLTQICSAPASLLIPLDSHEVIPGETTTKLAHAAAFHRSAVLLAHNTAQQESSDSSGAARSAGPAHRAPLLTIFVHVPEPPCGLQSSSAVMGATPHPAALVPAGDKLIFILYLVALNILSCLTDSQYLSLLGPLSFTFNCHWVLFSREWDMDMLDAVRDCLAMNASSSFSASM